MTGFDYAVLGVLGFSLLVGVLRGLVKELVMLSGWIAAYLLSTLFAPLVARYLPQSLGSLAQPLAYLAVFVGVLIIAGFVALVLSTLTRSAGLGWVDRALGAGFGMLRGVLVALALGLNIVVGFAGLLDLGYIAFYGVGAYAYALLASPQFNLHLPFWIILPIGALAACVFGVLLGAPTLKLRGDYLAIVTLGFGEIIRITANNSEWLGGPRGINAIKHPPRS